MTLEFNQVREALKPVGRRDDVIIKSLKDSPKDGYIFEFGVFEGKSINLMARHRPEQKVFGFDTFEGLPEDWVVSPNKIIPKGYPVPKEMVKTEDNVTYIKGMFQDTLEEWMVDFPNAAALVHIDSDLYSSCKYVLTTLNEQMIPGTVILFDDFYRWGRERIPNQFYANWEEGEWKALNEWLDECNRTVKPLYRCNDMTHWSASFLVVN